MFLVFRQQHAGIGRSPYVATFGCPPRLGLRTTTLPPTVASVLQTEEELNDALDIPGTSSSTFCPACRTLVADGGQCPCDVPPAVTERNEARKMQEVQATKMVTRACQKLQPVCRGENVRVGIPDVDRSRVEQRNMVCVVLQVNMTYYSYCNRCLCVCQHLRYLMFRRGNRLLLIRRCVLINRV